MVAHDPVLWTNRSALQRAASATALVDRLLGLARRPGERAAAHYLAARAAERDGDLATAERHLQQAADTDPEHVLAVDLLDEREPHHIAAWLGVGIEQRP